MGEEVAAGDDDFVNGVEFFVLEDDFCDSVIYFSGDDWDFGVGF